MITPASMSWIRQRNDAVPEEAVEDAPTALALRWVVSTIRSMRTSMGLHCEQACPMVPRERRGPERGFPGRFIPSAFASCFFGLLRPFSSALA